MTHHSIDDASDIRVFLLSLVIGLISRVFFNDFYTPIIVAVVSGFAGVFAKKLGEYVFDLAKKQFGKWKRKRAAKRRSKTRS